MKKLHLIAAAVAAAALGLTVLVAHASPENFWDVLAKEAGQVLGRLLSDKLPPPLNNGLQKKLAVLPLEAKLGATYSSQNIAETSMTQNSSTTCAIQNTDVVRRIITRYDVWVDNDTTSSLNGVSTGTQKLPTLSVPFEFDVATSTNAFTTSTASTTPQTSLPIFLNQYFATSTNFQHFVSTTFGISNTINPLIPTSSFNMSSQWNAGEWLNMKLNGPASSTGFCAATYFNE